MLIRFVAFDVFGTLVEIGDKRRPFARLMQHIQRAGKLPADSEARSPMTRPLDLRGAALAAGCTVPEAIVAELEAVLAIELKSIRAFPDTGAAMTALRAAGVRIALCSNLAQPYAEPALSQLPFAPDAAIWSFAVGAVKPEPAIYRAVCDGLGCAPADVLFVGDTREADFDGPRAFGMRALHLVRRGERAHRDQIGTLAEIANRM